MFKIYDTHYREVTFPIDSLGYGLRGLDINIGPIIYENIYTQSSYADKLVKRYPKDRDVSINILFTSMNKVDWRLKRDRVYAFFRKLGVFYIAESHQPFKLLKVTMDESYEIDRPVNIWGQAEIPLKIIDTPFKKSLHTTMDIDREGVHWNDKWAYGMGLSSDSGKWKYSFEPNFTNSLNLSWKNGGISTLSGLPNPNNINNIYSDIISVKKGQNYTFKELKNHPNVNFWRVFEYQDGEFIKFTSGNTGTNYLNFEPEGNEVRFSTSVHPNMPVRADNVGVKLEPILVINKLNNSFKFYNAGTEEIKLIKQKESTITLTAKANTSQLEIYDGKTTFKVNHDIKSGDVLTLKGHQIMLDGNNIMHETNAEYLTIKRGWNEWEIRGIFDYDLDIDFRFLYD